jgi:predicted GIY-YIG superfamily endonuclease
VYRLRPWLVRALIPPALIGTYVLYRDRKPIYVGRSDRDLQQRLLQHAATIRGDYFTYDVHPNPMTAFDVECSLFHALADEVTNLIHPDRPNHQEATCLFCFDTLADIRQSRLSSRSVELANHANTN